MLSYFVTLFATVDMKSKSLVTLSRANIIQRQISEWYIMNIYVIYNENYISAYIAFITLQVYIHNIFSRNYKWWTKKKSWWHFGCYWIQNRHWKGTNSFYRIHRFPCIDIYNCSRNIHIPPIFSNFQPLKLSFFLICRVSSLWPIMYV